MRVVLLDLIGSRSNDLVLALDDFHTGLGTEDDGAASVAYL